MSKNTESKKCKENKNANNLTKPANIKGKIEVSDTRVRRDGPGGN